MLSILQIAGTFWVMGHTIDILLAYNVFEKIQQVLIGGSSQYSLSVVIKYICTITIVAMKGFGNSRIFNRDDRHFSLFNKCLEYSKLPTKSNITSKHCGNCLRIFGGYKSNIIPRVKTFQQESLILNCVVLEIFNESGSVVFLGSRVSVGFLYDQETPVWKLEVVLISCDY